MPPARVECYSGYKADERPGCFTVGERRYMVLEVLERWYGPDETGFRVRAEDGSQWVLRRSGTEFWTAEAR